jgi:glutamine synthetase
MDEKEIVARFEVLVERYAKILSIESNVMIEMFDTQILPAVERDLIRRFECLEIGDSVGILSSSQKKMAEKVSLTLNTAIEIKDEMTELKQQMEGFGWEAKAKVYCELVFPKMEELRRSVDELEMMIEDELWPVPKYREMLY